MCEDCFQNLIYRFDDQKDFDDFEDIIRKKLMDKKLERLEEPPTKQTNSLLDPTESYRCNSCRQSWSLSIPETYWRGFFLTQEKSEKYLEELKRKDRFKGVVGLTILIILAVLILWRWLA